MPQLRQVRGRTDHAQDGLVSEPDQVWIAARACSDDPLAGVFAEGRLRRDPADALAAEESKRPSATELARGGPCRDEFSLRPAVSAFTDSWPQVQYKPTWPCPARLLGS